MTRRLARLAAAADGLIARSEARLGLGVTALGVAMVLFVLACLYVTPAIQSMGHGQHYERMSLAPFDLTQNNKVQERILTPLLAHLLMLRGRLYILLTMALGVVLIAVVFAHFRRKGFARLEALGTACLMTFATPILTAIHFQGYVDTTSYLLLFLCIIRIETTWLVAVLYALALLNHESTLFAAPWLVALAGLRGGRRALVSTGIAAALALVPMVLYRAWVKSHGPVGLGSQYFLDPSTIEETFRQVMPLLPLGVFMAFKLFWWFALAGGVALVRMQRRREAAWLVLVFACAMAQLVFGHDTSRLLGLAFPAILFGAAALREQIGPERFAKQLWFVIGLGFLVPTYCIFHQVVVPFIPTPVSYVMWLNGIYPWDYWWG